MDLVNVGEILHTEKKEALEVKAVEMIGRFQFHPSAGLSRCPADRKPWVKLFSIAKPPKS